MMLEIIPIPYPICEEDLYDYQAKVDKHEK